MCFSKQLNLDSLMRKKIYTSNYENGMFERKLSYTISGIKMILLELGNNSFFVFVIDEYSLIFF